MSYLIHFLCLCCFLTTVIECQLLVVQEPSIENDQLKNLLLVGSNVLVGSETMLYQLNSESLTTINKLNISASGVNRLLLQLEIEGDADVLVCQSSSCLLLNSSNVMQKKQVNNPSNYPNAEETLVSVNTNEDADPLVGIVAGNSFFAAREDLNTLNTDIATSISRISYNDTTDELRLSLIGQQEEGSLFIQRIFRTVFKNDEFVYFVFELELDRSARFVQLCLTDPGTLSLTSDALSTYTEVELQCGSGVFPSSASEITIDGQLMVLVSMHPVEGSSAQSQICIFNVSEISTTMNDALHQCVNVVDNNPPSVFINNLDRLAFSDSPVPCQIVNGIVTPCSRGGISQLPLGIDTPVTGRSVLTSTNSQQQFSSLVSFTYEGITYVFAGTGTNVDQYYYANDALQFIRSVNVSSSDAVVDEIHLSSDYEYFYALTTSSVSRYPVNICDHYTDCTSCVESMDPLCSHGGWCTLTSTCTKSTDCTTIPQVWETTDEGCPRITNVQPDFIFTNELDEVGVNFTLTYKNIPNVTYECTYTFNNESSVTTSAEIISNDTLVCSPPPMNSLPPCGEENTLSALLSLRTVPSMATIISYSDVKFTNCSTQESSSPSFSPCSSPSDISTADSISTDIIIGAVAATAGVLIIILVLIISVCVLLCVVVHHKRNRSPSPHVIKSFEDNRTTSRTNEITDPPFMEIKELTIDQLSSLLLSSLIKPENLKLIEKIGQGEFGLVYRGLLTIHGKTESNVKSVAVKTLKGSYSKIQTDELIIEAEKMIQFDHFNVLSLTGVCVGLLESPCIVMPFMSNGSLLSYLRKEAADLTVSDSSDENLQLDTKKQLLSMCLQVAKGVAYLSENKFVHRDLAARNCMISGDGVIKVADFGLAEDVYTTEYFKQDRSSEDSVKLPLKWMALESIHYGKFSEKSDVWSFGVLCWEVFSVGKSPYPGMSPLEVVEMLDSGRRLAKPSNAACCDNSYGLILSCWEQAPDKRPHFFELVEMIEQLLGPLADYVDFTSNFTKHS